MVFFPSVLNNDHFWSGLLICEGTEKFSAQPRREWL